jgi:hypothetical protein
MAQLLHAQRGVAFPISSSYPRARSGGSTLRIVEPTSIGPLHSAQGVAGSITFAGHTVHAEGRTRRSSCTAWNSHARAPQGRRAERHAPDARHARLETITFTNFFAVFALFHVFDASYAHAASEWTADACIL